MKNIVKREIFNSSKMSLYVSLEKDLKEHFMIDFHVSPCYIIFRIEEQKN